MERRKDDTSGDITRLIATFWILIWIICAVLHIVPELLYLQTDWWKLPMLLSMVGMSWIVSFILVTLFTRFIDWVKDKWLIK